MGKYTGKATIVFKDIKSKENWVDKYNGEFLET